MADLQSLVNLVRRKHELRGIAEEVIKKAIEKYQKAHALDISALSHSEEKQIVKDIRASLRHITGRFRASTNERRKLLEKRNYQGLLLTHTSTAERISSYHLIRQKIEELAPRSILDIGCGLNPIALAHQGIDYHAVDINEEELQLIKEFFEQEHITGTVRVYDIRDIVSGDLPAVDLCLILKVFDVIERRGHKIAERILNAIDAPYFLISFSTKTLSGRPMNHPQRGWIKRLCERRGYHYKEIPTANELFYLVKKSF